MITYSMKNNLVYFITCVKRGWLMWQFYHVQIVLILANKCTWWQVYSALVQMMVYQISKVCLALMYIQQKYTVYGKFHLYPYLCLDQSANDNAYSTPLRHEVWNVDHKMIIIGIYLCYNTFSHLCVKHQYYPEDDTVFLSIFFHWIVYCFYPDQKNIFAVLFCQMVLKLLI